MNATEDALTILRTRSLSGVLEREIEKAILGGEIPPGKRVNENLLATRFGTSRGPVREALRALEGLGLVELIPNRGVFIRQPAVEEAIEIYDVRTVLFGLAGKLLAERVGDAQVARLKEYLEQMEEAARSRDFDRYYPLNLAFHEFIIDACGNATLAAQYRGLVKKLHLFRARSLVQGGGLEVSNSEHREMVEAVAARDPERAQRAHSDHVARAKARLLAAYQKAEAQAPRLTN
ncbi:FCD domain-containing protein [Bosea caraganae]|uniref:FCD domain-containing protein n=1 Tax=Bosea caraganae TaxID=2763117 RepID=A0A370L9X8_9HYPH|nr:FCD domain-containing protein [Bosea caraganae]RDJ21835.1 FCD domain-containing protein [Bosea caraganae]RDJ28134.1 FCD domain-containing protein [Bosea caraganae]